MIYAYIGTLCSIIKSYPQMISAIKNKHTRGINVASSWIWAIGLVCILKYTYEIESKPLMLNCALNLIPCLTLLYYNYFPGA